MSYTSLDTVLGAWARRHGLVLPTRDDRGSELHFRNAYTSNHDGECCQIWIDPPEGGMVGVHAASVESRGDEEMRQDWCVPERELESVLDTALLFVRAWMTREL